MTHSKGDGSHSQGNSKSVLPVMGLKSSIASSSVERLVLDNNEYLVNHLDNDDNHATNRGDDVGENPVPAYRDGTCERFQTTSSVIIKDLPHQLFTSQELKNILEGIITQNGVISGAKFYYLTIFRRCRVDFESAEDARKVREMCSEIHLGPNLGIARTHFMEPLHLRVMNEGGLAKPNGSNGQPHAHMMGPYLHPPKLERAFLISPPSSPPVGWQQAVEPEPVLDRDQLMLALQALHSQQQDEPRELLPATDRTPQIIIHPCNSEQVRISDLLIPAPTKRPD